MAESCSCLGCTTIDSSGVGAGLSRQTCAMALCFALQHPQPSLVSAFADGVIYRWRERPRCSPATCAGHRQPRLLRRQRVTFLKQLDGDLVRGAHKRHVSIARRAKNRHAARLQSLTQRVDVIHLVGEVAEVAAIRVGGCLIPIVGKFNGRGVVLGPAAEENQGEASLFTVASANFAQAEELTKKMQRSVQIEDPDHRV